jgi:hypothetical protein
MLWGVMPDGFPVSMPGIEVLALEGRVETQGVDDANPGHAIGGTSVAEHKQCQSTHSSAWSAIISHRTASTRRKANYVVTGYRTPSWFRAKRNVELKQAKAKTSGPKASKRKKRK